MSKRCDAGHLTFALHWHVGETPSPALGAGKAGGSMDAANIRKPAPARGAIRVIGATANWKL
ncbi:MAG: hypothetical protein NTW21_32020 [Verrucomicrobia bacterium]|nr:hypothetical protein [Verrucomicrobiota bacterium]